MASRWFAARHRIRAVSCAADRRSRRRVFRPRWRRFYRGLGQRRQAADHGQTGLFFEHRLQQSAQSLRTIIEQNSSDMVRCAERRQPAQLRRQRQACPLGPHNEQCGQVQRIGQLPRAGCVGHAAKAVVVAHGPLDDCRAVPRRVPGVECAGGLRCREEQVEIVAFDAQHRAVEHRVDVVRPRLERAGGQPAGSQRRQ